MWAAAGGGVIMLRARRAETAFQDSNLGTARIVLSYIQSTRPNPTHRYDSLPRLTSSSSTRAPLLLVVWR